MSGPYNGPITIVTWLWKGWRPLYTAEHVNRLHRMLIRHMTGDWTLVCITDMPEGIECETFPLWQIAEPVGLKASKPNCFRRLRLFHEEAAYWFGPKILSIDLDCNIYRDLRPLLTTDSFKAANGYHSYYNGSLWQVTPGVHREVWTSYDPVETPKIIAATPYGTRKSISGSDQAWMSIQMPNGPRWTEQDGIYQHMHLSRGWFPANARAVFFAGMIKPWDDKCKYEHPRFYAPEGT